MDRRIRREEGRKWVKGEEEGEISKEKLDKVIWKLKKWEIGGWGWYSD